MTCRHLTTADEAVAIDPATGRETPTTVHLCTWADDHPDRLIGAPRWVQRNMLGGHLLRYPQDCEGCPGFSEDQSTTNPRSIER